MIPDLAIDKPMRGLVLSGGAAWGSYEVGVTRALVDNMVPCVGAFEPQVFTGTSIGSFNASYLVSHWDQRGQEAVRDLEHVWFHVLAQNDCANGGYRIRFNPLRLNPFCLMVDPTGFARDFVTDTGVVLEDGVRRLARFFSTTELPGTRILDLFNLATFISPEPWEQTIRSSIDFEAIRQSSRFLRVVCTNWSKGRVRIFENEEMTPEMGLKALRASSALPGFYPPQIIDNQQFVDGGVLMNTPLKPAIRLGARELEVINMTSPIVDMPLEDPPSTFESLYRMQIVAWAAAVNRDIERVRSYNRAIEIINALDSDDASQARVELETGLRNGLASLKQKGIEPTFKDLVVASSILEKQQARKARGESPKKYFKIKIHRFYPTQPLGDMLSLLDLRRNRLMSYFQQGYADSLAHDCVANRCVL